MFIEADKIVSIFPLSENVKKQEVFLLHQKLYKF